MKLTLPKPVTDKYFQDSLEVGYPLVRAVAQREDYSKKFLKIIKLIFAALKELPKTPRALHAEAPAEVPAKKRKQPIPHKFYFGNC